MRMDEASTHAADRQYCPASMQVDGTNFKAALGQNALDAIEIIINRSKHMAASVAKYRAAQGGRAALQRQVLQTSNAERGGCLSNEAESPLVGLSSALALKRCPLDLSDALTPVRSHCVSEQRLLMQVAHADADAFWPGSGNALYIMGVQACSVSARGAPEPLCCAAGGGHRRVLAAVRIVPRL